MVIELDKSYHIQAKCVDIKACQFCSELLFLRNTMNDYK